MNVDVLVLGTGVAGLSTAIAAEAAGLSTLVVTKGEMPQSATWYAQGGVAAALEAPDSPDLHFSDTMTAGAGLCDTDAVRILVDEGPHRVRALIALGAHFDREDGEIALGLEGGHSIARVLHAGGDRTGAEIERALVHAAHTRPMGVLERAFCRSLIVEDGECRGGRVVTQDGEHHEIRAPHTVLATGGAGQLFSVTTNPVLSTGDGVAMAFRAGAAVADVEFMQFHPTALHHAAMPRPLLSEALRGEGATLRDLDGRAFMADEHPMGDLAPRDVVSAAITRRLRESGAEHLWLDATNIDDFAHRFPGIWGACTGVGLDPATDWLPIAPAAHYLSGGVMTDLDGATTVPRLWACGETACVGVHGANRLASNSLLDGLVFGPRSVEAILDGKTHADATGVMRGVVEEWQAPEPRAVAAGGESGDASLVRADLQRVMTVDAGVLRDADSLEVAAKNLDRLGAEAAQLPDDRAGAEVRDLATVASLLIAAATRREESRGTHRRLDFPGASEQYLGRFVHAAGRATGFVSRRIDP